MPQTNEPKSGLWKRLGTLIANPNSFFDAVPAEKGIGKAFLIFVIVASVTTLISVIFSFMLYGIIALFGGAEVILSAIMNSFFSFLYLIGGICMTFVSAGVLHLLVLIFRGQSGYSDTYKVYVYSMIPFLILRLIPFIGFMAIFYSLVLMIIGFSRVHKISIIKSAAVCLIPVLISIVIVTILIVLLFIGLLNLSSEPQLFPYIL
ncbi:MAG: hypothetical protein GY861_22990 [bacterium]|nr:hypothetical protein [bacterium]